MIKEASLATLGFQAWKWGRPLLTRAWEGAKVLGKATTEAKNILPHIDELSSASKTLGGKTVFKSQNITNAVGPTLTKSIAETPPLAPWYTLKGIGQRMIAEPMGHINSLSELGPKGYAQNQWAHSRFLVQPGKVLERSTIRRIGHAAMGTGAVGGTAWAGLGIAQGENPIKAIGQGAAFALAPTATITTQLGQFGYNLLKKSKNKNIIS